MKPMSVGTLCATLALVAFAPGLRAAEQGPPASRTFLFTYGATITGLTPGQTVRVWVPSPPSNEYQTVRLERTEGLPPVSQISHEPKFGNDIHYFTATANSDGKVPFSLTYHVVRKEVRSGLTGHDDPKMDVNLFLKPDARVPVDGKPLTLLKGQELPKDQVQLARSLYQVVYGHMRYSKEGTGWGQGDANWACDSGYGNCSDFHSLFISLSRSQKLPARFIMGFPLPEKTGQGDIPGYHCWAEFKPEGKGWIPVDISEASKDPKRKDYYFGNLTDNRIAFSMGRDLTLVPKQDGPPLNFFIYPYVEVDGKPYPADKIERKFSYQDVEKSGK